METKEVSKNTIFIKGNGFDEPPPPALQAGGLGHRIRIIRADAAASAIFCFI